MLMLKMKIFWLIFCGKFEQKTQKSIFLKNQWRLKNIKKAMVVKNIIAEDMAFTKSIFEQFWRSYCKKTIFVVFHFLKFLPKSEIFRENSDEVGKDRICKISVGLYYWQQFKENGSWMKLIIDYKYTVGFDFILHKYLFQ